VGRGLAPRTQCQKPADRGQEWLNTRTDRKRDAQRHLWVQRKPATWKFLPRLLPEHLRKPRMGATASQGPYQIAKSTASSGLEMEGTGLREQLGCAAHECLL